MTGLAPLTFPATHLGAGRPLLERVRTGAGFLSGGHRDVHEMLANHWYAADALAGQLGLGRAERATLAQTFERWDGHGAPNRLQQQRTRSPAKEPTPCCSPNFTAQRPPS